MTAKPYPPWSGRNTACPKCHSQHVTHGAWQPGRNEFMHSAGRGQSTVLECTSAGDDWCVRECRDCGYTWPEQLPTPVDKARERAGR